MIIFGLKIATLFEENLKEHSNVANAGTLSQKLLARILCLPQFDLFSVNKLYIFGFAWRPGIVSSTIKGIPKQFGEFDEILKILKLSLLCPARKINIL